MPGRVAATSRLRSLHHRGSRDAATLTRIVSSYREATAKRSGCRSVAARRTRSGGDAPLASSLSHAAAHARTGVEIPAKLIAPSPRRVSKPRRQHTRSINNSETFEAKLSGFPNMISFGPLNFYTTVPNKAPMPAVTAIARAPQNVTRVIPIRMRAPPV